MVEKTIKVVTKVAKTQGQTGRTSGSELNRLNVKTNVSQGRTRAASSTEIKLESKGHITSSTEVKVTGPKEH